MYPTVKYSIPMWVTLPAMAYSYGTDDTTMFALAGGAWAACIAYLCYCTYDHIHTAKKGN